MFSMALNNNPHRKWFAHLESLCSWQLVTSRHSRLWLSRLSSNVFAILSYANWQLSVMLLAVTSTPSPWRWENGYFAQLWFKSLNGTFFLVSAHYVVTSCVDVLKTPNQISGNLTKKNKKTAELTLSNQLASQLKTAERDFRCLENFI